jgi:subtilase family serine protease
VLLHLGFAGLSGFFIFGGTSAGSPQMAAVIALANQAHGSSIGFVNTKLYSIAESASYTADFHDITIGNNQLLGTPTGNTAAAGYDLATGWRTPTSPTSSPTSPNPNPQQPTARSREAAQEAASLSGS